MLAAKGQGWLGVRQRVQSPVAQLTLGKGLFCPKYFQDCADSLSSLEQAKKRCSRGGCHSFNNSNLFPRDFMHLTPIKTRGTPTCGTWPALCLTPADIWNRSFKCHLPCSLLQHPAPANALQHPEKGLKSGCLHVKFPELCSEVCHKGSQCVPLLCPLCELAGRALPVSQAGTRITTRQWDFPGKDPTH